MTRIAIVCTVLCVVFSALFHALSEKKRYRPAFWVKGLAGLCFVAVGLSLTLERLDTAFPRLIFFGLVMGLIGDELLAMRRVHPERREIFFICGTAAFALGHVFYLRAMWSVDSGAWLFAVPIFALLFVAAGAYILRQKLDAGRLFAPGVAYIVLVTAVAAMGTALLLRGQGRLGLRLALGGVSFLLSDSVLCAAAFGEEKPRHANWVIHTSYYVAQLLIAWSIAA